MSCSGCSGSHRERASVPRRGHGRPVCGALLSATALVSASLDEGFGIPVIEAMRLGTPVVISDIQIFQEIGGDAAILVDPHDPAAFARAIRTLDDPAEWAARSHASLKQAELFSWDASAAVLWDVLVELGGQPKR